MADLVKVDILLQGETVDAFSAIVHKDKAYAYGVDDGRQAAKELIPRQQFEVPIQAAIGVADHRPRDHPRHPQGRPRQVLRRRHHPQAQAAGEAEGGQEADEDGRPGRGAAGGLHRRAVDRGVHRPQEVAAAAPRTPSLGWGLRPPPTERPNRARARRRTPGGRGDRAPARATARTARVPRPRAGAAGRHRLGAVAGPAGSPTATAPPRSSAGCRDSGIELALAMGTLQWVMALIVAGIGALVLAYCAWYFDDDDPGCPRSPACFVAFVGVDARAGPGRRPAAAVRVLGADDGLLVPAHRARPEPAGQPAGRHAGARGDHVRRPGDARRDADARRRPAGTYRISEILADPPTGVAVTVARRAAPRRRDQQVGPAPVPLLAPGGDGGADAGQRLPARRVDGEGRRLPGRAARAGVRRRRPDGTRCSWCSASRRCSLGGWRALRQNDLKLLLAYGTVSQLGFLVLVLGIGTRSAVLAGLALLLAHALFKATLFLVVGIVDHSTGTRDLRELSGRRRAGCPVARRHRGARRRVDGRSAAAARLRRARRACSSRCSTWPATATAPGSVRRAAGCSSSGWSSGRSLTAAYTARFLWGAFADQAGAGADAGPLARARASSRRPVAAGGAGAGARLRSAPPLTSLLDALRRRVPAPGPTSTELALWHGSGCRWCSPRVTLAVGAGAVRRARAASPSAGRTGPRLDAERAYRLRHAPVDRSAVEVTGVVQRGSVAAYLAIILVVLLLLPGRGADRRPRRTAARWCRGTTPAQAVVGAVIVAGRRDDGALAAPAARSDARRRHRLRHGPAVRPPRRARPRAHPGPGRDASAWSSSCWCCAGCPQYFTDRPLRRQRYLRMALGAAVAVVVAGFVARGRRGAHRRPGLPGVPGGGLEFGGGRNIVNVILVDIRAWDTLGEISVLVAAATGVASLVFVNTRDAGIRRVHDIPYPAGVEKVATAPGRRVWLPGPRTLPPDRRSIIFEVVVRLLFHRWSSCSRSTCCSRPQPPRRRLRRGHGHRAGADGALPGRRPLRARRGGTGRRRRADRAPGCSWRRCPGCCRWPSAAWCCRPPTIDLRLPLLGELHLVSSVVFDVGVYLVVVGLVLDLLRALGSRIDRQILRADARAAEAAPDERQPDPGPRRRRPHRLRGLPGARAQPDPRAGRHACMHRQRRQPAVPGRRRAARATPLSKGGRPGRHVATRCPRRWSSPRSSSPSATRRSCSPWPTAAGSSTATTTCRTTSRTPRSGGSPLRTTPRPTATT